METLHRLHIADPQDFQNLKRGVQSRHLAHTYNVLGGWYEQEKASGSNPHHSGGGADPLILAKVRAMRGE